MPMQAMSLLKQRPKDRYTAAPCMIKELAPLKATPKVMARMMERTMARTMA